MRDVLADLYPWILAFHIIAVMFWMAGMYYLPRLFVYHAEAMEAGSPVCGSAYFLSQDEPVNCWDWINEILALVDLPRVRRSISYQWAKRLGHTLETIHHLFNIEAEPRMTRFLAAQLAKNHYFDISRAKQDFDYKPVVSNDEGMRRLQKSLQSESS